jgi:hypothetical protein
MRRILLIITFNIYVLLIITGIVLYSVFNIELLLYVSIGSLVLFVLIVLSILLYLVLEDLD